MSSLQELGIRELDPHMIPPCSTKLDGTEYGGSKIIVVGRPGSGKSSLIKSLFYHKKHIFPVAMAMSGSEDSNKAYREFLPSTFVYNGYDEAKIKEFIKRQKIAREHLPNPWAIIALDDCTDDTSVFNKAPQPGLFKRGRWWNLFYILSLQYAMDVKPVIRNNTDGIFILRDPILTNREKVWRNFATIIPDLQLFCNIMDQITEDYTALYIHNAGTVNKWQDCVYYYKADLSVIPKDWKFGCNEYWDFHDQRFNKEYVDNYDF